MGDKRSFDFRSFVLANKEQEVSSFDYLHAIYKSHGLPDDFIIYIAKLFCPEFRVIGGLVFISELFDSKRYKSLLKEGRSAGEAQFWMNLIEITGLFDELSTEDAMSVAESLAACWNAKMGVQFKEVLTPARAIRDDETGEIFVTIGTPS